MSSRLLIGFVALSGAAFVSCVPYPDQRDPRQGQQHPQQQANLTTPEQQALEKQRAEKKKRDEQAKKEAEELGNKPADGTTAGHTEAGGETTQPKPKPKEKKDYPFASKIEGKTGFVLSPYTNSMVDVRDIPAGTLVEDPTQKGEKKLFRVP